MRTLFYSLLCFVTLVPALAHGQADVYAPLVNIPGNEGGGFEQYISFLYGASISVAALLAVVKIIIAGAKYMLTDLVSSKGSAKEDIQGAILGLLLILGAVIILEFINPQLTKGDIQFEEIKEPPQINLNAPVTAAAATADFSDTASNAARNATLTAGCFRQPKTVSNNYTIEILNSNPCSASMIAGFTAECTNKGGTSRNNQNNSIFACAVPIETVVLSKYGTVLHQKGNFAEDVTFSSVGQTVISTRQALLSRCSDLHGTAQVLNTGSVNESVTCTYPAVISYSGSQANFAVGDCADRVPKGRLIVNTLSPDVCIVE